MSIDKHDRGYTTCWRCWADGRRFMDGYLWIKIWVALVIPTLARSWWIMIVICIYLDKTVYSVDVSATCFVIW